ncbi:MAG TPA: hypothetical protein VK388_06585 [Pyrinomonadaceae bacterium]|nr:hypothetical protein [Pyrinomonadaceae bacterium]
MFLEVEADARVPGIFPVHSTHLKRLLPILFEESGEPGVEILSGHRGGAKPACAGAPDEGLTAHPALASRPA